MAPIKRVRRSTSATRPPVQVREQAYTSRVSVCTQGGPFLGVSTPTVKRRAEKMLMELGLSDAELSIALVNDAAIQTLNRDYRSKNKPTDVLAFAMEEGPKVPAPKGATETRVLGDVIISIDTAENQARKRKRPLLTEVTMLLAHGLLHLLGYDHQTDEEEAEMKAKTRTLEKAAEARSAPRTAVSDFAHKKRRLSGVSSLRRRTDA